MHRLIDTTRCGTSAAAGGASISAAASASARQPLWRSERRTKPDVEGAVRGAIALVRLVFLVEQVLDPQIAGSPGAEVVAERGIDHRVILHPVRPVGDVMRRHVARKRLGDLAGRGDGQVMMRDGGPAGRDRIVGIGIGRGQIETRRDPVMAGKLQPRAARMPRHLRIAAPGLTAGGGGVIPADQILGVEIEGGGAQACGLAPAFLDADVGALAVLALQLRVAIDAVKLVKRGGAEAVAKRGAQQQVVLQPVDRRDPARGEAAEIAVGVVAQREGQVELFRRGPVQLAEGAVGAGRGAAGFLLGGVGAEGEPRRRPQICRALIAELGAGAVERVAPAVRARLPVAVEPGRLERVGDGAGDEIGEDARALAVAGGIVVARRAGDIAFVIVELAPALLGKAVRAERQPVREGVLAEEAEPVGAIAVGLVVAVVLVAGREAMRRDMRIGQRGLGVLGLGGDRIAELAGGILAVFGGDRLLGAKFRRALGGDVDHAGHRLRAVKRRVRALEHLDAADIGGRERAEVIGALGRGRVAHLDAVDEDGDVLRRRAAQIERGGGADRARTVHRDPGQAREIIGDAGVAGLRERVGGDDGDGGAGAVGAGGLEIGRDGDLVERGGVLGAGGQRGDEGGGEKQRDAQGLHAELPQGGAGPLVKRNLTGDPADGDNHHCGWPLT
ncbi:hypothetical protein SDC9_34399 [bioreactor metagenome]|uniref:Uncharacterized protein n=1 Tax=bioreactor metagenome TaxID=1076179 RepID=A0A644VAK9_9ZZZZ